MLVLAIDPATRMGWAYTNLSNPTNPVHSGTWDLSMNTKRHPGMRYVDLHARLMSFKRFIGLPAVLVYEQPGNLEGHARKVLPALQGVLELWALENNIPQIVSLQPTMVKRHATGKGNAKKDAMVAAARRRWPQFDYKYADQADALWVLDCYIAGVNNAHPSNHQELPVPR